MSETKTVPVDEMTNNMAGDPVPGHDKWVREQVKKRLEKKKAGKAVYHKLEDAAAEFGFDARSNS